MLVEFGSGSSTKTRLLLDHLESPAAYVPVDVSCSHLEDTARQLARDYPQLDVHPVCADFTNEFALPSMVDDADHVTVYFPGSTIGNFERSSAMALLKRIAALTRGGGGLVIGIDLQKDREVIETAYNDPQGVTAAFNLNLLRRINRELGADFRLHSFHHRADYNEVEGRIEMSLVSDEDQTVTIGNRQFCFTTGERILTEYSHKYTIDAFASMAADCGLSLCRQWRDESAYFAVLHFESQV
jgi:dimethylhistidine N-methyltransferase